MTSFRIWEPLIKKWNYINDVRKENNLKPYKEFIISTCYAALTSVSIYGFFTLASFLTEGITNLLPLNDPQPAQFLALTLNWGASISGAFTFITVTIYQFIVLIKNLRGGEANAF
ncbi:MAG: hypothetical protein AUJ47_12700 [Candidatus Marinimicrobia bacterium CG1_02_48_14]|nr:MAG: hypothetical protein AUJ47_12700 [Candidatus Marinimicrobia bacterium CG1_02_48_14]